MEIPSHIKSLYRHWDAHLVPASSTGLPLGIKIPEKLAWFIAERIDIWKKKVAAEQEPYTADPILSQYRFCNIYRELDRQTIMFHERLNPLREDFGLWLLNMFYCRLVARPETIALVGLLSFDEEENERFYKRLMASPRPRFGTAYVFPVSTIQKSAMPTRELFLAKYLPRVMPAVAREILSWEKVSVYEGVRRLLPAFGFNHSFLWTEVLIDVAYQFPARIDLFGRFPIGPGALPTFEKWNDLAMDHSVFVAELARARIATELTYNGKQLALSAENWEGIGCEFRKYNNLEAGRGRRRLYFARPHN